MNWWDKAVKEYTDKLDAERKERAESLRTQLRDILGMQTNPDSSVVCLEYLNFPCSSLERASLIIFFWCSDSRIGPGDKNSPVMGSRGSGT